MKDGCLYDLIRVMLVRAFFPLRRTTPLSRISIILCGTVQHGASIVSHVLGSACIVQKNQTADVIGWWLVGLVIVFLVSVLSGLVGVRRGRGLLPHEHPARLARPHPVPAGQLEKLSLSEDWVPSQRPRRMVLSWWIG